MAKLGFGPKHIPRRKLSVEKLTQAITVAVTDDSTRQRAPDLGSKIQDENGG